MPKLYELPGKKKKSKKGKKKGKKAKTRKPIKGNVLISVDPKDKGSLNRIPDLPGWSMITVDHPPSAGLGIPE